MKAEEREVAPRQLIVAFRRGVTDEQIRDFYARHALEEQEDLDSDFEDDDPEAVLVGLSVDVSREVMEELARHPLVEFVEPNYLLYADLTPNDPQFGSLWGLHNTGQTGGTPDADIDAPEAWNSTTGSASTVIAVVDTGVQVASTPGVAGCPGSASTHPDLAANLWVNPGEGPIRDGIDNDGNGKVDDIHGWNFFDNASWLFCSASEDNHGTHVAGTIAAVGNNGTGVTGVNWQAKIMVLKFIGPGGTGTTANAIQAVNYAASKNARVINASWGGGGFSQALKNAIEACSCVFAAAAGNGGLDQIGDNNDLTPHYPSSFDSANLIAVAATDHKDALAGFSNFGPTSVDLGAPGVSILSTLPINTYGSFSGTSMATPHVAGVAGLVLSQSPPLTPLQVKNQILNGVDPVSALNGITVTGGRLNAAGALAPAPPPPPPPAAPSELVATAVSTSQINLSWVDNATTEDGFRIERRTGVNAFVEIATVGADVASYSDVGLAASTTYTYQVRAFNAGGNSLYSNEASATTSSSATATFTSIAAEDGHVTESSETSNAGGSASSTGAGTGGLRAGDNGSDRQIKAVVSFDTSSLPDGATILSATLLLKRGTVSGTNPFTTHGTCHVDIKGGSGFGGSTALVAGDFQAAPDAVQVATLTNAAQNGDLSTGSLNPTGLSLINKTGKTQFRIYFARDDNDDLETDYIGWYPGNNATASNRPVLEVVYQ